MLGLSAQPFQYLSPLPDANYIAKETSILIKTGQVIEADELENFAAAQLRGVQSGRVGFEARLGHHRKTVILKPHRAFLPGERVEVRFPHWNYDYEFTISRMTDRQLAEAVDDYYAIQRAELPLVPTNRNTTDTLPATISISTAPADGYFVLAPLGMARLYIVDNELKVFKSRPIEFVGYDFNRLDADLFAYCDYNPTPIEHILLDTSLNPIDTFTTTDGVTTDFHELLMTPDGHTYLIGFRPEMVDMSVLVSGGEPEAMVSNIYIQEFDLYGNLVFEWRSFDHLPITDIDPNNTAYLSLTSTQISYVHPNALEIDTDGNLLMSSRNLSEVTKINRQTGEVMWRMGGGPGNEFTFINDPNNGFSDQHDVRRLPNGNISIYDNSYYDQSSLDGSRLVEYEVDEINKTASVVRTHESTFFYRAMGNAQLLPNDNYLVNWGLPTLGFIPSFTEYAPDGTKTFEVNIDGDASSYRVTKIDWPLNPIAWPPDSIPVNTTAPISDFQDIQTRAALPNPATEMTTIPYQLSDKFTAAYLEIFDINGHIIQRQLLDHQSKYATINVRPFSAGVYFYRIRAGEKTGQTFKLVISK